ncbi:MAG TPA: hypothetical protein PKE06_05640 [Flavilitoribacter sp.]|nr:hypothetical protein [Flavilitoribacter sp.]HMQ87551.1 hypothetical protein [Flavilitoribacter sp.]
MKKSFILTSGFVLFFIFSGTENFAQKNANEWDYQQDGGKTGSAPELTYYGTAQSKTNTQGLQTVAENHYNTPPSLKGPKSPKPATPAPPKKETIVKKKDEISAGVGKVGPLTIPFVSYKKETIVITNEHK